MHYTHASIPLVFIFPVSETFLNFTIMSFKVLFLNAYKCVYFYENNNRVKDNVDVLDPKIQ